MFTYANFRKANPATRCFQPYTYEQRADLQASHRLGYRQRESVGHFFYTHPMVPGIAFDTAKQATTRAFEIYQTEHAPMMGHNGGPSL